jgi:uncharacterized protein
MRTDRFTDKYGPWALVAGGSVGLGAEFARQLARRGLDLFLLAEAAHPMAELAEELRRREGVEVRSLVLDLAKPDLLEELAPATDSLEVGLLVSVAAHAPIGPFLDLSLEDKLRVVDVNCRAPLVLAHHFGASMARRGRGGVVVMSSIAGLQGSPFVATYAASKAFGRVLAEGLWSELGPRGVDVLAVCAGPTRTPAFEASRPRPGFFPPVMEPSAVVDAALRALGRRPSVVAGWWNLATALVLERLLPRRHAVRAIERGMMLSYPRLTRG